MFENEFGSKIKELRKLHGFTQKDVATHLGVTPTQISDIEKGKTSTSFNRAIMLALLFNTSLDYLAGISTQQSISEINNLFDNLTHEQQIKVLGYIDALKDK